jgi:hypothetical protein
MTRKYENMLFTGECKTGCRRKSERDFQSTGHPFAGWNTSSPVDTKMKSHLKYKCLQSTDIILGKIYRAINIKKLISTIFNFRLRVIWLWNTYIFSMYVVLVKLLENSAWKEYHALEEESWVKSRPLLVFLSVHKFVGSPMLFPLGTSFCALCTESESAQLSMLTA